MCSDLLLNNRTMSIICLKALFLIFGFGFGDVWSQNRNIRSWRCSQLLRVLVESQVDLRLKPDFKDQNNAKHVPLLILMVLW